MMAQKLDTFCAACGGDIIRSVGGVRVFRCKACNLPDTSCTCPETQRMRELEGRYS